MSKSQTTHLSDRLEQEIEALSFRIGQRTTNLFASRQLWCAEAVFSVLNQVLKGGLSPTMAIRLSSGFPEGVGGSGCACGSLNGAVMAIGLFLGRDQTGFNNNENVCATAKQLHTFFKTQFGATCCRVLSKDYKRGSPSDWARLCRQGRINRANGVRPDPSPATAVAGKGRPHTSRSAGNQTQNPS